MMFSSPSALHLLELFTAGTAAARCLLRVVLFRGERGEKGCRREICRILSGERSACVVCRAGGRAAGRASRIEV
eukprot:scaffold26384_cov36-Tisochrysis_lutea.AAC.5